MSKEDIASKWMTIGTNSKRKETHSPEPFFRVFLGEKGIGRFAIEKIADYITLESKQLNSDITHKLIVNWSIYEDSSKKNNSKLFTNMLNQYEPIKETNNSSSGTILTFENLKEVWTDLDIKRIKRELSKLVSPIDENSNKYRFKIFVKEELENVLFTTEDYEEIINSSLLYATKTYKISFNKEFQQELHFNDDTKEIEILENKPYAFGPIKMNIYYFNSADKRKFKLAYKSKELQIDGFKVYRDGILATPFVETASTEVGVDSYRDIFGVDKKRWSNTFNKLSTHDFIGIIEITKEFNPKIKDLTNRQDFEDTEEYKAFKEFIFNQLRQIELKLEHEKKLIKEKELEKLNTAQNEIIDIRGHLDNLLEKEPALLESITPMYKYLDNVSDVLKVSSKEIDELNQTIERKEELYHSLMSLQEYAADLAHMVRNSLDKILSISRFFVKHLADTKFFKKSNMLNNELLKMREDVNYMLDYAESGHKLREFDMSELILEAFDRFDEQFEKEKISIQVIKPESFPVTHVKTFVRDIFNNLISNSRRSLRKTDREKKIIKCTALKEEKEFIIIFSDNGIGIEDNIKDKIFDRYFSTNKDEGGSGIGLYVVKNNLKTLNGKIELINSEFETGATFKITIPLKEVDING
jgi:signal transduction histidine kinase